MTPHNLDMQTLSNRLYGLLLRLYPAPHREAYGDLMRGCFDSMVRETQARDGALAVGRLWLKTLADSARNIVIEHLYEWRHRDMQYIANYQIKRRLADGSAADIYLALDPISGRDVALKVMRHDENEKINVVMFANEAIISTQVRHPASPRVYNYAVDGKERYLAMEFIEGETLVEALEKQVDFFSEREVIAWGIQLCDFLTHLHERSVIFCDMKPGNLMRDQDGKLRVIDFGIAHSLPEGVREVKDVAIGTVGYSSPEQYAGIMSITGDIYALGATLYHLITRRDPRKPDAQFLFHVFPPRKLNPAVSEAFETVILKANEHKAADRYQSAAEMKAALQACL